MEFSRLARISEELKREISDIIRNELKDPRVPMMTSITKVEVTSDLKYAKVYVSVLGDEDVVKNAFDGLNSATGFVRKEVGSRIRLRYTPQIIFVRDTSIEYGVHISKLLHDINTNKPGHEEQ
ncbi:30S ribosome-binding factor RbfA [Mahella sp.]|jgi:ribosome-binding factor A|uniref:30S ribosome-binding factor RbfA n=1 Tax=Mahella sp. TaxID=2798721 RepID=UPI0025BF69CE|nr:30S ribosome-binding factor RbfA [Mahella sp.]MBZ4665001.1 ribosome-binding factor [Mahella sp.]MDK2903520.1 ribosome-binding factor [Clostridiales bacterium]